MFIPACRMLHRSTRRALLNVRGDLVDVRPLCRVDKPISKCHMLYDSYFITCLKSQEYRDGEQMSRCQKLGLVVGEGRRFL